MGSCFCKNAPLHSARYNNSDTLRNSLKLGTSYQAMHEICSLPQLPLSTLKNNYKALYKFVL